MSLYFNKYILVLFHFGLVISQSLLFLLHLFFYLLHSPVRQLPHKATDVGEEKGNEIREKDKNKVYQHLCVCLDSGPD